MKLGEEGGGEDVEGAGGGKMNLIKIYCMEFSKHKYKNSILKYRSSFNIVANTCSRHQI